MKATFWEIARVPKVASRSHTGTKERSLASNPRLGGVTSFRPLNTPSSIAVWAMAVALAGCGSQATDPVRLSKVIVISGDGTSIQLVVDMCQGQPYNTVVKESAHVVNIQLLGTGNDGDTSLSCADLVEVRLPSPLSLRRVHDATAGADVPVQSPPGGIS